MKAWSRARRQKAALKSLLVFSGKKGRAISTGACLYSGSSIEEDEDDDDDVEEEEDEAVDMAAEDDEAVDIAGDDVDLEDDGEECDPILL